MKNIILSNVIQAAFGGLKEGSLLSRLRLSVDYKALGLYKMGVPKVLLRQIQDIFNNF